MKQTELIFKLSTLPENLASKVNDFIDRLLSEKTTIAATKKPKFGSAKGLFKMSKNFDAPLDDFNDYMF